MELTSKEDDLVNCPIMVNRMEHNMDTGGFGQPQSHQLYSCWVLTLEYQHVLVERSNVEVRFNLQARP